MDSLKTEDFILGFQDESSPQTIANTVRKWCPEKPRMIKNTNKIKANSMGFYAIRGRSVIEFPQRSKTDDMCMFLESVRRWNDGRPIDGKLTKARYVRCYSNGSSSEPVNNYIEIEVFGK